MSESVTYEELCQLKGNLYVVDSNNNHQLVKADIPFPEADMLVKGKHVTAGDGSDMVFVTIQDNTNYTFDKRFVNMRNLDVELVRGVKGMVH